jgi:hypothetical protein
MKKDIPDVPIVPTVPVVQIRDGDLNAFFNGWNDLNAWNQEVFPWD